MRFHPSGFARLGLRVTKIVRLICNPSKRSLENNPRGIESPQSNKPWSLDRVYVATGGRAVRTPGKRVRVTHKAHPFTPSPLHRFKFKSRAAFVAAVAVVCLAGLSSLVLRTAFAAGNVTGTVFQDFDGDGTMDATDFRLGGVTVTAFDATGTAVATATTSTVAATLGQYTLNLSAVANGTPLRIEFTGLPDHIESGPQGAAAGNSGSSIQFITTTAAAIANINYGVNNPGNFCQANPRLATNSYAHGDQSASTRGTVVTTTYTATGTSTANYNIESRANQVGSTWGLAYHRTSNTLFAAPYIKRNAGLAQASMHPGSDGTGTIYRITVGTPVDGAAFVDLDVLFGNATLTGVNPHTDFDPNPPDYDSGAYGAVGKVALGGLAVSEDDQTLYAINLVDRRLYRLPIGLTPTAPAVGAVTSSLVPSPTCTNGVGRPFAVKAHNGLIYVGGVCTAELAGGTAANLSAYVYAYDPATSTWGASPVIQFALNYARGCADIGGYPTSGCRTTVAAGSFGDWRPWRDTLDLAFLAGYGGGFIAHPQAMLTNIEFIQNFASGTEDMILAFRDRFGDQIGTNDPGPTGDEPTAPPANGSALNSTPAGEILRAGWNGSVWVIEQNSHNAPGAGSFGPNAGAGNQQGPASTAGGDTGTTGEYYLDNHATNHDEIAEGGLAYVPGNPELAASVMDPLNLFTGGTTQFTNTTGARVRSYEVNLGSGGFAKADSFGDLEAICNVAPIELGNRVWNDANADGVQQPGEAAIANVAVRLMDSTGVTTIATATTNTSGNFLFSSGAGTNTASAIYSLTALDASTTYQLRIDTTQGALAGLTTTRQNNDPSANGDSRDSDSTQTGTQSIITLTTGGVGANDHTFDFGFALSFSIGNRVFFDTNNDGAMATVAPVEVGIDNIVMQLVDSGNNVLQTQNTSAGGYYRFDGVTLGTYTVRVAASNFAGAGALVGYQNSTGATVGTDRRDNGVDVVNPSTAGISSAAINVASGGMPTLEPDFTGTGVAAHGPNGDGTDNLLIDFGFYRMTLGNLCWTDSNNNGLFAAPDLGLAGCVVRLYQSDGVTEIPVGPDGIMGTPDDTTGPTNQITTPAGGAYLFSGLTPGNYVAKATPPAGGFRSANVTASTVNPNNDTDNDDNGLGVLTGQASSNAITLTPGVEPTVTNATATSANNTLDFGFTTAAPTAVRLANFSAKSDGVDTLVSWQTGFEVSNLGYVLYREDAKGRRVRVTPSLVAGSALVAGPQMRLEAGMSYAWWEPGVGAGARYWLEAYDLDGSREMFGPFGTETGSLPSSRPAQSKLLNELTGGDQWKRQREFASINPAATLQSSKSGVLLGDRAALQKQFDLAADPTAVKLKITKPGWYSASRAELVAAGMPAGAPNSNLQLYLNGVEIPIEVSETDGSVRFYGQALDTLESDTNVYWIVVGTTPGRRIAGGTGRAAPNAFTALENFDMTVERRDRIVYFSSLLNGEGGNFFGPVLAANAVSQTVDVRHLDVIAGGGARLEVSTVGLTLQAHQVRVQLNGTTVGTINSSDREQPVWSVQVKRSLIHEGENTVTLQSIGGEGDVSLTDFVRLTYPRRYRATNGSAEFTVGAGAFIEVGGFSGEKIRVLDITDPNQPQLAELLGQKDGQGGFDVSLPSASYARRLIAMDQSVAPLQVSGIDANGASQLNMGDGREYQLVVIAPAALHAALTPLIDQRHAQGIDAVLVDVEDVFDEFSFGQHTAHGIKNFLAHTRNAWPAAPGYVLLVGDSTYDPRNYLQQGDNDLVPTKLVDTDFMETASDEWFVDFDNDSFAEMSIGRLPVRTSAELSVVVGKLLTYDDQPAPPQRTALMVSDTDFVTISQFVQGHLPGDMSVATVHRGSDSDAALRQLLLNNLNTGPSIVNFTGHGQLGVWTGGGLFATADTWTLTNERPSVYIMLSCLNNFSHDAYQDSLGEGLLKSQHGAAAVWGSSGITYSDPQVVMALSLYQQYGAGSVRIGDAIRTAKSATYSEDVRRTWLLFGDPTMRLR